MQGNTYDFKDVETGEIYKGTVVFYRNNGFFGQEAQVEFNNFVISNVFFCSKNTQVCFFHCKNEKNGL